MKSGFKSFLLVVLLGILNQAANAQVNVVLRQPVSWHFTLDQIWNADILNAGSSPIPVVVNVRVSKASGALLVEAKSAEIVLNPGINTLNASRIVSPKYIFAGAADVNIRSGVFPFGKYTISMRIYDRNNQEIGIGSLEEFEINVLSPPLLFVPSNESEISTQYPLLSWSPPSPLVSGLSIVYDLRLVEVMPGQTPYDAVRRNFARVDIHDIPVCYLQYPASSNALEDGKKYAWQVVARNSSYVIGETEIWTFNYVKPRFTEPTTTVVYSKVKKIRDGSFCTLISGRLYFQYDEQYAASVTRFEIFDGDHKSVSNKCNQKLLKKTGDNRFEIDIEKCSSFKKGYYFLEIENEKQDKFYLTFKVD